ncbi:DUF2795 domain-containing protein [Streptomyces sp. 6N223]|uniref:DUF2795 domain-containing protein n=1 Tax=Streptomyces sp. 6N223 TaxID=3457412 RepID=UPI003FCF046D
MAHTNPIEVQKALKGADYPASKDDLIKLAQRNHAKKDVVEDLSHMRRDRFDGPNEVEKEMFGS